MKFCAKSVALVLGILLCALPVLAAVPCSASACAMQHCACCCGHMNEMAMGAPAATVSAPPMVLPHALLEPSAPACDCAASTEVSASAMMQAEDRSGSPADAALQVAIAVPDLMPPLPQVHRTPRLAEVRPPAQSVLCTFLI